MASCAEKYINLHWDERRTKRYVFRIQGKRLDGRPGSRLVYMAPWRATEAEAVHDREDYFAGRTVQPNTTVQRSPRIPAALSFKIPDLGRNDKNDAAPGPYARPASMTDGRHRREMEERGLLGFDGEFSTTTDALKKVLGDIGIERIRAHRRRAAGDRNARGRVYIANKRHVTAELISMANHDRVDVFHDGRRP